MNILFRKKENKETPICKDCTFYVPNSSTVVWDKCSAAPLNAQIHLIRGNEKSEIGYCTTIRANKNECGPSGKWFVKKVG